MAATRKLKGYQTKLLDAAKEAMERAYNPYSKFFVGSALLTKSGQIITGSNFENASYGNTICAERSALVRANAMGHREFRAVAVIAKAENSDTEIPTAPCGACRQMLFEASQISRNDLEVIMSNTKMSRINIMKISKLLPLAFGPKDMGVNLKRYGNA
jgi:cytidine deaminase